MGFKFFLISLISLFLTGCFTLKSEDKKDAESTGLSYDDVFQTILSPRCVGCHSSGSASGGVALDSYNSVVMYVVAGNPEFSLLYEVVSTNRMPKTGSPLSAEDVAMIRNWILLGAP
ncbi:MAG: c-type cytochrome domain-containing protein [Bdellovibrionia bacterium]